MMQGFLLLPYTIIFVMLKIIRPTLIIDEIKCKNNILFMVEKARTNNLVFRPHFKTHQSAEIGDWFREIGVDRITVSSVSMATYFAEAGWKDILIAFPVNLLEMDQINKLAGEIKLSLTLESEESTEYLGKNLIHPAGVYVKIDTGYHRTGILFNETEKIRKVIDLVRFFPNLKFNGFLTHAGNTYSAGTKEEILQIHHDSIDKLNILKQKFKTIAEDVLISIGDTPSCSVADDFNGVDEIRPGNFVFYDVMQSQLGSCTLNDIAVMLACPVVAIHPERNELIIYGGAVHLSKEFFSDAEGKSIYGLIVKPENNGWGNPLPDTYVKTLSQEHGIIKTTLHVIGQTKVGDILGILPVHSCLTADQMKEYFTPDGQRISMMH